MIGWQEDMLGLLNNESLSKEEVFTAIQQAGKQLGFQFVSYGIRVPLPAGRPPSADPRELSQGVDGPVR